VQRLFVPDFKLHAKFSSSTGGSVAKYAGQHVHQRLTTEEAYAEKDYHTAFKKAFLGTDDDLRAGSFPRRAEDQRTWTMSPIFSS
jgi:hypothetical protein